MGKFDGKTAVVTGASRGIGRAIAKKQMCIRDSIITVHIVAVVYFGDFVITWILNGVFLVKAQQLNEDTV